jgi:hypothetical protein
MQTGKEIIADWKKMKQDCPSDFPLEIELLIDEALKEAYNEGYKEGGLDQLLGRATY